VKRSFRGAWSNFFAAAAVLSKTRSDATASVLLPGRIGKGQAAALVKQTLT
jgi:hypothetical protein